MKRLLFILAVAAILLSCETEIEYKGEEADPSLYVYALFDSDSLNCVFVGETSFFLDNRNTKCLTDAKVTIQRNHQEQVTLAYDSDTALYVCPLHYSTGDTLYMTISHPRLGTAAATAIVPPKIEMETKEVVIGEQGVEYDNYAIVEFTTEDYQTLNNQCYFTFKTCMSFDSYEQTGYFGDSPRQWVHYDNVACQYYSTDGFFRDDDVEDDVDIWSLIFGGDAYSFFKFTMSGPTEKAKVEFGYNKQWYYPGDSIRITGFSAYIRVYTSDYVDFMVTQASAENEDANPFVEPTQVKCNVKPTGETQYAFGVFGISR